MINRRKVVQGIGAGLSVLAMPSIVRAQELRKIRMGFGIKSVNPIIINILISEGLGYTKEEGLQFTPAAARHQLERADRGRQGRHRVRGRHAELPVPAVRQGSAAADREFLRVHLSL